MPENPTAVHIVGVTGAGRLIHTSRTPDGWTPFVDVLRPTAADQPDLQGHVTEVTAARIGDPAAPAGSGFPAALVVAVLAPTQPHPIFFCRYADTGQWVSLGAASGIVGARRIALSAAEANYAGAAAAGGALHLAWTGRGGQLLVSRLRLPVPGAADPAVTVEHTAAVGKETFRIPALSGSALPAGHAADAGVQLRLAGVTTDGRAHRVMITSRGTAELLGDVEAAGAGEVGDIVDAAVAIGEQDCGCEYYAAVTGDGRILLAANDPADGSWTSWRDLEEAEFVMIGQGVTMTYREVSEFGTFARVALAIAADGLHVLGVTTNGKLLHQLQAGPGARPGDGQEFRDVELAGVGSDVGEFTAVAAA